MDWNALARVCLFPTVITIIIRPWRLSIDRYDDLPHGHWDNYDHQSLAVTTISPMISQSKIRIIMIQLPLKTIELALFSIHLRHNKLICQPPIFDIVWNFGYLIFQIISVIDGWVISCELALRWMSLDVTDDQSTLVQVMAWCLQATSHYLSQCWPRSLSPYGITRPQWVKEESWLFSEEILGCGICIVLFVFNVFKEATKVRFKLKRLNHTLSI